MRYIVGAGKKNPSQPPERLYTYTSSGNPVLSCVWMCRGSLGFCGKLCGERFEECICIFGADGIGLHGCVIDHDVMDLRRGIPSVQGTVILKDHYLQADIFLP